MDTPEILITDDGVEIPSLNMKSANKAPGTNGIPAELFKTSGPEKYMLGRMHEL